MQPKVPKKKRVPIPADVKARAIYASARTCCICQEPGKPLQVHHIDEDPANNEDDNLGVLCLLCHNDTQLKGGFGRHLSASDVRLHRNQWLDRVMERRKAADAILLLRSTVQPQSSRLHQPSACTAVTKLTRTEIGPLIDELPDRLSAAMEAYRVSPKDFGTDTIFGMIHGRHSTTRVLRSMWLDLSEGFPENHFAGGPAEQFIDDYITQRSEWHYALAESEGPGTGGTIVGVNASIGVLRDVESTVVETVKALRGRADSFADWSAWKARWESAKEVL